MDVLAEQKGEFVRVMVSVLHPQIIYKTLHITKHSTVFEVVVKLVSKYAFSQEDKDNPDAFYMTEVYQILPSFTITSILCLDSLCVRISPTIVSL